jgi:hypothetical protein
MFHQFKAGKLLFPIAFFLSLGISPLLLPKPALVSAHEVEISGDVAATFHIEPNHNPKAAKIGITSVQQ